MDKRKEFESIVSEYSEQLYFMIRRIVLTHEDANDVLQNTFLKAWNAYDTFNRGSKLSTWLTRIAINESLDQLRRHKHMASTAAEDLSVGRRWIADRRCGDDCRGHEQSRADPGRPQAADGYSEEGRA